jgi:hypothetical protein
LCRIRIPLQGEIKKFLPELCSYATHISLPLTRCPLSTDFFDSNSVYLFRHTSLLILFVRQQKRLALSTFKSQIPRRSIDRYCGRGTMRNPSKVVANAYSWILHTAAATQQHIYNSKLTVIRYINIYIYI